MHNDQPSLFSRNDTMLGICQGLGEDLGFNPDILRVAFIPALFFYPVYTVAGYFAAGVVVLLSRLLFPHPRAAAVTQAHPISAAKPKVVQTQTLPELDLAA